MKPGDMVRIFPHVSIRSGWDTNPGEYGFHRAVQVDSATGVVLEVKGDFCRVFSDGSAFWIDSRHVELMA